MRTVSASACLTTFVSASWVTRKMAVSSFAGSRRPSGRSISSSTFGPPCSSRGGGLQRARRRGRAGRRHPTWPGARDRRGSDRRPGAGRHRRPEPARHERPRPRRGRPHGSRARSDRPHPRRLRPSDRRWAAGATRRLPRRQRFADQSRRARPPERVHRDRDLGDRRPQHARARAEAADLLRLRPAGRRARSADRGAGAVPGATLPIDSSSSSPPWA